MLYMPRVIIMCVCVKMFVMLGSSHSKKNVIRSYDPVTFFGFEYKKYLGSTRGFFDETEWSKTDYTRSFHKVKKDFDRWKCLLRHQSEGSL